MDIGDNKQVLDLEVRTYHSGPFTTVQLVLKEIHAVITLGFLTSMEPGSPEAVAFGTLIARLPDVLEDFATRPDGQVVVFDFTAGDEPAFPTGGDADV